ncbi:MAG: carbon-nitrogen hydrolase family protein [Candidatus Bathyarchaeaceae archaeon]
MWSKLDGVEVHLIQMLVEKGKWEKNMKRAVQMIEKAIKGSVGVHEVDIIGLPETFATGFPDLYPVDMDLWRKWGEPVPDEPGSSVDECPTLEKISEVAEEYGIYIQAGTVVEVDKEGNVYNTATLFDPTGKYLGKYRKVQAWIPEPGGGDSFPVFDTHIGKIGIMICYDGNFPEIARLLALNGAEIIFRPSEWNDPFSTEGLDWWKIQNIARAIENHCYVAAVSCVGEDEVHLYPGRSMIVDPYGRILIAASDGMSERILGASVDVNEVRRIRETWKTDNHLQQIKLDIYAKEYANAAAKRKGQL